jgi:hypothetical protein
MGIDNGRVQDRELYSQILGIRNPWRVERVANHVERLPPADPDSFVSTNSVAANREH